MTSSYGCDKNIPIIIEILPHQSYLKELSIVYDPYKLKRSEKLKIGVNINKNFNDNPFDADYDELTKYNLVWSNEIFITNYK